MTRIIAKSLAVLLTCFACAASASGLTESEARQVVDSVEAAAMQNDLKTVAKYLSDDCEIISIQPTPDGQQKTKSVSKQKYIADETKSQAELPGNAYRSTLTSLTLDEASQRATAILSVTQSFDSDGRRVSGTGQEVIFVEMRNGAPLVVKMRLTMTGMTIDGRKVF